MTPEQYVEEIMTKTQFAWHCHHEVLVEPLTEPFSVRVKYIKENKPEHEQEIRLRLFKKVKGKLPSAVVKAWVAYDKAWVAYDKASAAYDKAGAAYVKARAAFVKALADNMPAILELHAKECPNCPWDGKTIFPNQ